MKINAHQHLTPSIAVIVLLLVLLTGCQSQYQSTTAEPLRHQLTFDFHQMPSSDIPHVDLDHNNVLDRRDFNKPNYPFGVIEFTRASDGITYRCEYTADLSWVALQLTDRKKNQGYWVLDEVSCQLSTTLYVINPDGTKKQIKNIHNEVVQTGGNRWFSPNGEDLGEGLQWHAYLHTFCSPFGQPMAYIDRGRNTREGINQAFNKFGSKLSFGDDSLSYSYNRIEREDDYIYYWSSDTLYHVVVLGISPTGETYFIAIPPTDVYDDDKIRSRCFSYTSTVDFEEPTASNGTDPFNF